VRRTRSEASPSAVVVLGFVVYKSFAGSSATTYTGTAPTPAQANNSAALAAAVAPAAGGFLSSLFGSGSSGTSGQSLGGALSGMLGGATTSSQLDQTYSSTGYNPDAISSDIAQDTTAAMSGAGESDLDSWGFTL
jgi:hypothetical protein